MEDQSTSLNWEFCSHLQEGREELRRALLYTNLELETTIMSAKEEILRRECEIMNLKDLLNRAIKEKGEVEARCGELMFDNLVLTQQKQNKNQEPEINSDSTKIFACSESDDNTIQSSQTHLIVRDPLLLQDHPPTVCKNASENEKPFSSQQHPQSVCENACEKSLPQIGKLLQAVIDAGPLLQNLLLAGPMPRWQHPPPLVDSVDIPPVIISPHPSLPPAQSTSIDIRKSSHSFLSDGPLHFHKHQKVVEL